MLDSAPNQLGLLSEIYGDPKKQSKRDGMSFWIRRLGKIFSDGEGGMRTSEESSRQNLASKNKIIKKAEVGTRMHRPRCKWLAPSNRTRVVDHFQSDGVSAQPIGSESAGRAGRSQNTIPLVREDG